MYRLLAFFLLSMAVVSTATFDSVAQSGLPPVNGCETFDFTTGQLGWEPLFFGRANYVAGQGWEDVQFAQHPQDGPFTVIAQIKAEFAATFTVTRVSVIYDSVYGGGDPQSPPQHRIIAARDGNVLSPDLAVEDASTQTGNGVELLYEQGIDETEIDEIRVNLVASQGDTGYLGGDLLITEIEVCGISDIYVKPLKTSDEDEWPYYEIDEGLETNPTVAAFSDKSGAFVHAAVSGTVIEVERATNSDCAEMVDNLGSPPLNACILQIPQDIHGSDSTNDFVYTVGQSFGFNLEGGSPVDYRRDFFKVVIEADDGTQFVYLVKDALQYVEVGNEIEAGCQLGKTIEMYGSSVPSENTVTIVGLRENGEFQPLIGALLINPTGQSPCGQSSDNRNCFGDSELTNPDDWTTSGPVTWSQPGVSLGPQSQISTQFNLDASRQPRLRVSARTLDNEANLRMVIGQTSQSFDVESSQYRDFEIAGAAHQPDTGGFYSIVVSNDSRNATIDVEYICVSFTLDEEGDPIPEPPADSECYFDNHSFSDGTGSWFVSSGIEGLSGELEAVHNSTFYQPVTLHPATSGAQTYTISATVSLWYYSNYTPDPTDSSGDISIEYDFPEATASAISIGSATYGVLAQENNLVTLQNTFSVSQETSGNFQFQVIITNAPTGVAGVKVREVCLSVGDRTQGDEPGDEPFPGYPDPADDGTPEPDLFPETCEAIGTPSGDGIGTWISWQWSKLNRFFQCDLMVLLNDGYRTLRNFYTSVGWSLRWMQANARAGIDWLGDQALPWLAGYLSNASGVVVYQDSTVDNSCEWWNIVCHLGNALDGISNLFEGIADVIGTAIRDVLGPVISALWNLIAGFGGWLLDGVLTVLGILWDWLLEVLGLFGFLGDFVNDIIASWNNADPELPPGVPNCESGDMGNDSIWCWGMWSIENTVLSGAAGALIIPLLSSVIAILIIINFANGLLRTLREAGLNA